METLQTKLGTRMTYNLGKLKTPLAATGVGGEWGNVKIMLKGSQWFRIHIFGVTEMNSDAG